MHPPAGSDNDSIWAAINPTDATHPIILKKSKLKKFLGNFQYGNNPIYSHPYLLTPLSPTLNLFFWTDFCLSETDFPPPFKVKKIKKFSLNIDLKIRDIFI